MTTICSIFTLDASKCSPFPVLSTFLCFVEQRYKNLKLLVAILSKESVYTITIIVTQVDVLPVLVKMRQM